MVQLQNNFTTPEQSKRLLELGVPADSADCYYQKTANLFGKWEYNPYIGENVAIKWNLFSYRKGYVIPCWSVGRLIEIGLKCSTLEQRQVLFFCNGDDDEYSLIDYVVNVLWSGVMTNHIDFSKLEE